MTGSIGTEARPGSRLTGMWVRMKVQCDNCFCWEFSYDMWQCPSCADWICLDENETVDSYPNCMIHDDGVCADCCVGYEDGCGICAYDYCDECDEQWDDCECDDDDDD